VQLITERGFDVPLKTGAFTKGELAFIEAYAAHQDREKAEKAAGIAPRSGYSVLSRPDVQAEITRRITADLHDLAAASVDTLRKLITGEKVPAAVRFNAAKYTLDRVLGDGSAVQRKELHEMTQEEIAEGLAKLEAVAASMAKPVNPPDPGAIFD
jgi:hypothetical protein